MISVFIIFQNISKEKKVSALEKHAEYKQFCILKPFGKLLKPTDIQMILTFLLMFRL